MVTDNNLYDYITTLSHSYDILAEAGVREDGRYKGQMAKPPGFLLDVIRTLSPLNLTTTHSWGLPLQLGLFSINPTSHLHTTCILLPMTTFLLGL